MAAVKQAQTGKGVSPSMVRTVVPGIIGELRVDKAPFGFRLSHPARFNKRIHAWLKVVGARWNHDCWEIGDALEVGLAQRLRRYERECEKSGRTYERLKSSLEKEAANPLGFKGDGYHVSFRSDTYYVTFPFHPRLVAEIKKIPGKRYIDNEWRVPVTSYDEFAPFAQRLKETYERLAAPSTAELEGMSKEASDSLVSDAAGVKVKCDGRRYQVIFTGSEGANFLLSHVPGAFHDDNTGVWYAPVSSYDSLSGALLRIRSLIVSEPSPEQPSQGALL